MNLLGSKREQNGSDLIEGEVAIGVADLHQHAKSVDVVAGIGGVAAARLGSGEQAPFDVASNRPRLNRGQFREIMERNPRVHAESINTPWRDVNINVAFLVCTREKQAGLWC